MTFMPLCAAMTFTILILDQIQTRKSQLLIYLAAGQELIFLLGYYLHMVLLAFLGCRLRLEVYAIYFYLHVLFFVATYTRELSISGTVVASSILVGFTTSLILFCSHFHQIGDDKAIGKFSPLVRLGTEGGANVVKVAVGGIYSLLFIIGLGQTLPFSSVVLCALTLPVGRYIASFVQKNHRVSTKVQFGASFANMFFIAKYYCVRLHTLFGAALAAGLVAARMFARKQLSRAILL
ncbi:hypothetical protein ACS0TY_002381 [Phlomoides rotata]